MSDNNIKWEFYQDNAGDYRWRAFYVHNGQTGTQIGKSSEGFSSERNAIMNAIYHGYDGDLHSEKEWVQEEVEKQTAREYQWEIYEDASHNDADHGDKGRWRWRFMRVMKDGTLIEEVVGASSEAYTTRESCIKNAHRFGYAGE